MKIINIDVTDKLVFKNIEDTKTDLIKFIKATLEIPTDNANTHLINFNFTSPNINKESLHLFAIFTSKNLENPIEVELTEIEIDGNVYDKACIVPAETLYKEGLVGLGLYGFNLKDDGSLNKRVSLEPIFYNVIKGSYDENALDAIVPTPSVFEVHFNNVAKVNAEMEQNLKNFNEAVEAKYAELENRIEETNALLNEKILFHKKEESVYYTVEENQTVIPIDNYISPSIVFVNVNGFVLSQDDYSIDTENKTIILNNAIDVINTKIHIIQIKIVVANLEDYDFLKGEKGDKGQDGSTIKHSYSVVTTKAISYISLDENYSEGDRVLVYINGLKFIENVHYSVADNTITFNFEIDVIGTEIEIIIMS